MLVTIVIQGGEKFILDLEKNQFPTLDAFNDAVMFDNKRVVNTEEGYKLVLSSVIYYKET